jgi:hypothetical protein
LLVAHGLPFPPPLPPLPYLPFLPSLWPCLPSRSLGH